MQLSQFPKNLYLLPALALCLSNLAAQADDPVAKIWDQPKDIAWAGNYFWAASLLRENSVSVLNGSKVKISESPLNISDKILKTFYKIRTKDGRSISINQPSGITWDGRYLWLSTLGDKKIWKLSASSEWLYEQSSINYGKLIGGIPSSLTWDGQFVWVADSAHERIYGLDPLTGRRMAWFYSPSPNSRPSGIAWDGKYLWISTYQDSTIWKVTREGTIEKSFPGLAKGPVGLSFGKGRIWFSDDQTDEIRSLKANTL